MGLWWDAKTADEVVQRSVNWAGELNGDYINTYTLTVDPHGSLVVLTPTLDTTLTIINVTVSGGTNELPASILCEIVTGDGRTLQQIVAMNIREATSETIPTLPSTTTKRTLINMAYEEAGLPEYVFNRSPEQDFAAMRRLDALMAEWAAMSIDLSYNFPVTLGQGNQDESAGVPDWSVNTIAAALAFRLFPGLGETASGETKTSLSQGMNVLMAKTAFIPSRVFADGTPRGAGNKPWSTWWPLVRRQMR